MVIYMKIKYYDLPIKNPNSIFKDKIFFFQNTLKTLYLVDYCTKLFQ